MNYYIEESVLEAVLRLRLAGLTVEYKEDLSRPEWANAYVVSPNNSNDIKAIISSTIRWRKAMPDWQIPEDSKACVQATADNQDIGTFVTTHLKLIVTEE